MKPKALFFFFLAFLLIASSCRKTDESDYQVVPLTQHVVVMDSKPFELSNATLIVYPEKNEEILRLARFLSQYIKEVTGIELVVEPDQGQVGSIRLKTESTADSLSSKEAYSIQISDKEILVEGSTEAGIFYAIQTFRKSLPVGEVDKVVFPATKISDFPRFGYRGALLDVSRHFFSVSFVKKYIDVLALFNMNIFHWHLTDDQGWRIEIKKYPKLTEIGSRRSETALDRHSERYDGKPYGGYYTQEQIREVVEYARQRYITVIPEIDIPGHTSAILASYPELGCTGGPYNVARGWGIYEDVLCVGNDSVFTFLDHVFSEVAELFPSSPYIHIGGDECLKDRWKACPKCQKRAKELGLVELKRASVVHQLQSYFVHRVEDIIHQKGKRIIGWDEILEGGIAPDATIMSWRGTAGGKYAANSGHDVIMTPEEFVYLDYYQSEDADNEPYTFGWLTKLDKVYSFEPLSESLFAGSEKHILGGQVNVWTEYMPEQENVEYMLLPRMAAFAETLWSPLVKKNYADFVKRMYKQTRLLDRLNYKNCKEAYGIEAVYDPDTINDQINLSLSTFDNAPIYYTLDGSEPTNKSSLYSAPLMVNKSSTVKAVLFRNGKKEGSYSREFNFNKATCRPLKFLIEPSGRYAPAVANMTMNDGLHGQRTTYRTGSWVGFLRGMVAIIKLDPQAEISSVKTNVFINTRGLLFPPKDFRVEVSDDGNNFRQVYRENYPPLQSHQINKIKRLEARFSPVKANYVRVSLGRTQSTFDHPEQLSPNIYLMLDEIEVN